MAVVREKQNSDSSPNDPSVFVRITGQYRYPVMFSTLSIEIQFLLSTSTNSL